MKSVAVAVAVSLGLSVAGCAAEKPVHSGGPVAPASGVAAAVEEESSAASAKLLVAGKPAGSDGSTTSASPVAEAGDAVSPAPGNGGTSVRDAKEATEEAARRILDATVEAATRIKEVGIGAVQAVRETSTRKNGDSAGNTQPEQTSVPASGTDGADQPPVQPVK